MGSVSLFYTYDRVRQDSALDVFMSRSEKVEMSLYYASGGACRHDAGINGGEWKMERWRDEDGLEDVEGRANSRHYY